MTTEKSPEELASSPITMPDRSIPQCDINGKVLHESDAEYEQRVIQAERKRIWLELGATEKAVEDIKYLEMAYYKLKEIIFPKEPSK